MEIFLNRLIFFSFFDRTFPTGDEYIVSIYGF